MKRKSIQFISLATGLAMLAGVAAGCGGEKKSGGQTIKLGYVYELTGGTATFGNSALNGSKLAMKEINAKGGVLGKQLEGIVADNKSEPSESANAMTKVVTQDKVVSVIGFTTSSNALAATGISQSSKVPLISAAATNPKVTVDEKTGKVKDFVFRVCIIDPFQGTVGANFALNTLQSKKAAIMIDNSSDYSKGLAQFFKESYLKNGGTLVAEEAYLQKDQDFKTILTKIKAANPDLIYVPGYYEEVGKIVRQAREMGITASFMGGDGWDSPKLVEIGTPAALNNTFFTNHYSPEDTSSASKAFVEAYKKEYNQAPDAFAVLGYDAVYLLADAIKRAGEADPVKIQQALAATKDFNAVTGMLTLNATHDAVKSAVIIEMKDGKQGYKATVKP